jgi:serine phosphatase RsbU (regulator of sigma subunit)
MADVIDERSPLSIDGAGRAPSARILVVDDDVATLGTLQRYLRQYDIDVAECVEGALEHLDLRTYDLVLLDRRLPDGMGDAVIEEVRKRRWSVPIIMMSGEIDPGLHRERPHSRADDFIEKPFVREALVSKIERLLTANAMCRQAAQHRAELAEMHARLDREVDAARTIFDRIFARGEFDPATVRHLVLAANRLAGDVVFGAWTGEQRYRWMIGDVTGHTLSSALVTMPLAGIFYRTARERRPLADVLALIERELVAILPANMFCAAAMCELDRESGTLEAWNGGNPDVLIRHVAGNVTRIPSMALPLAADRFAVPSHTVAVHRVEPGDRIYAFSDGLIELRDRAQRMIGFDRLLAIARTGSAATIFDRFLDCIPDRSGATPYDDDVSLIEVIV